MKKEISGYAGSVIEMLKIGANYEKEKGKIIVDGAIQALEKYITDIEQRLAKKYKPTKPPEVFTKRLSSRVCQLLSAKEDMMEYLNENRTTLATEVKARMHAVNFGATLLINELTKIKLGDVPQRTLLEAQERLLAEAYNVDIDQWDDFDETDYDEGDRDDE